MKNNLVSAGFGWVLGMFTFLVISAPKVSPSEIRWAQDVCATNGGIQRVERWYFSAEQEWAHSFCKNGAKFGMNEDARKQYEQK